MSQSEPFLFYSPNRAGRTGTLFVLAAALACLAQTAAQAQPTKDQVILQQAASLAKTSVSAMRIADQVVMNFPVTGVRLEVAKVINTGKGQNAYTVALDAKGDFADVAAAEAAEWQAREARYGRIDPRLYEKLAQMDAEAIKGGPKTIRVAIWLKAPQMPAVRNTSMATADTARSDLGAHLAALEQYTAPQRQGVMTALTRLGAAPRAPRYAPAVFATLTPAQVRNIARHADVAMIYGPEEYTRFADDSGTTARAHGVWQQGNLGFGTSSRPVVHEDDGISDGNMYLNNTTHPVIYFCSAVNELCPNGKNISSHSTEVAGVIASTHPLFRGMAPNAQMILSANSQDLNNDEQNAHAYEWARANGGAPVNMSWGTICYDGQTFSTLYTDWATSSLWSTSVVAAGNRYPGCTEPIDTNVAAPGNAWTAITVGAIYDNNSGFWSSDGMSSFSRYGNPPFATGMEKPEVVAVGQGVRSTDDQGGDWLTPGGVDGTSLATPAVAGQVVQMLARQPGLINWPETNKAAVLVSAWHDVVPGSTSQDGVGAVVMNNSDDTYRNAWVKTDHILGTEGPGLVRTYTADFTAGQVVRYAIMWDSWSTGGTGTDVLGADIDLRAYAPDGTYLIGSASVSNAWEMVEFTAPTTGTYQFQVTVYSKTLTGPGLTLVQLGR